MRKTIILNAGHCINEPGASTKTTTESQEVIKIRDRLAPLLKQSFDVAIVPDELDLTQSINWVNERYKKLEDGLAFSIHLNAGGGEGAEIFYYTNSKASMERAQVIIDKYCNLTRFRNGGVKPDVSSQDREVSAWIKEIVPWSFLLECCFIDNDQELQRLQKEYDEIAWAIYVAICELFDVKPIIPKSMDIINKEVSIDEAEPTITQKIEVTPELPVFEVDQPNPALADNTIKLRKIINKAFGLNFEKDCLQCTEYVQYKVKITFNIDIDWSGRIGHRHGGRWIDQFTRLGRYKILDTPKKGCAMSFANPNFNKPWGHVAFVEEVLEDENESIKISEANWPNKGIYNERTLSKQEWSQEKWGAKFIDFT